MRINNKNAFTLVFILLIMPSLLVFLNIVYYCVYLLELKNEFRFKCIQESIQILSNVSTTDSDKLEKINSLTKKLNNLDTPLKYKVRLIKHPNFETQTINKIIPIMAPNMNITPETKSELIYELKYRWFIDFKLNCGIEIRKEETKWNYKIIYKTLEDKS